MVANEGSGDLNPSQIETLPTPPATKTFVWPEDVESKKSRNTAKFLDLPQRYKRAFRGIVAILTFTTLYVARERIAFFLMSFNEAQRDGLFTTEFTIFSLIVISLSYYFFTKKDDLDIFLVDFDVWSGKKEWEISNDLFAESITSCGRFTKDSVDFQARMCRRTGLGEQTYAPENPYVKGRQHDQQIKERKEKGRNSYPSKLSMALARDEFSEVVFPLVQKVLDKNNLKASQIDILVVNCSLFCPTPSLATMVVNKLKMRSDIISFNLGGMGCSAGVIAIDLAKDLLKQHRDSYAIVVSTENIALNWYYGNERSMMLQNALFRCGAAVMLLSNKSSESYRAKYQLQHVVRVHTGADDIAYHTVYQDQDKYQNTGVILTKDLMKVAGDALKTNMTILGPLVLPWSEQIKFLFSMIKAKISKAMGNKPQPLYVPDFKKAFDHFCIHAGGRGIIDGLEKNLNLTPKQVEPSRATLYRYGNTSSSSIWYELFYSQNMGYIKKGDTIWQIALGSGFKCNSAVWKALRTFPVSGTPN